MTKASVCVAGINHCAFRMTVLKHIVLGIALMLVVCSVWSGNLKGETKDQLNVSMPSLEPGLGLGDGWLNPYLMQTSLEGSFKMVTERVRFEPYEGELRGVVGTAIARRGNSLEQAVLLKHVLGLQGYQTRLVSGKLDRSNAVKLLRGMYPPQLPKFNYSESYDPFKLETAERLISIVSNHYWVEVNQGTRQWLPLDPSFPRAKIGEAYAKAERYFTQSQDDWMHIIAIRLKQKTRNNQTKTVLDIEMPVSKLGYMPLSISCMGAPLEAPKATPGKAGSATGLFGQSLDGGKSTEKKDAETKTESRILGTQYNWAVRIPGQGSREYTHSVQFQNADTLIAKEWLEISLTIPGHKVRRLERVLFNAVDDKPDHQPSMYRRYVVEVIPGVVRPELAEAMHAQFIKIPINDWKQSMERAHKNNDFSRVLATDEAISSRLLQMIITRFAEVSDEASDRAAYSNGVVVIRSLPRVIIASVELEKKVLNFSIDLRLDEVDAIPFPDAPSKVAHLFQMGRGMIESTAEGKVLQQMTGRAAVTTSSVMTEAQAQGVKLNVVDSSNLSRYMKQSKLPQAVYQTLKSTLDKGHEIIIPEKAVLITGEKRWGWWQVEKESGRNVGVMDNGLHAALVEYTASTNRISLNPKMGFMVGMIVGADSTLFTISGLMIKHGQITPTMIKEAKDYLKKVLCSSCPKAEAKIGGSISLGGDCMKVEVKEELSAAAKIDFCEEYVNGFKCAAGLLMQGLTGESVNKAEIKHEISYELGCAEGKKEMGISSGL